MLAPHNRTSFVESNLGVVTLSSGHIQRGLNKHLVMDVSAVGTTTTSNAVANGNTLDLLDFPSIPFSVNMMRLYIA